MPDIALGRATGGSNDLNAYLAVPSGEGPWPAVVAIHEVFGLNDVVRRQADRLAAAGYLTLAPDLYSDGGARKCLVSTFRALMSGEGKAFADIAAARTHLLTDERSTDKVGIIGFCMGGGFALLAAARGFDVAAPNYGQPPKGLPEALRGSCPVVASYGAKDVSLRGAAGKVRAALDTLGVENDVKEYPTAGHSFLNEEFFGPGFTHAVQRVVHVGPDPVAAADAWARIESFFDHHLR
ncbi:dienelactone hydrolase family protein [uncultured Jatrophihabitans sp.]|uniref:dienelactone hydrolase family protein n=1 Tax=uncultured Jatrophihabitans sp. TaxID=1610747 RepID=UPI0035CB1731